MEDNKAILPKEMILIALLTIVPATAIDLSTRLHKRGICSSRQTYVQVAGGEQEVFDHTFGPCSPEFIIGRQLNEGYTFEQAIYQSPFSVMYLASYNGKHYAVKCKLDQEDEDNMRYNKGKVNYTEESIVRQLNKSNIIQWNQVIKAS